MPLPAFKEDSVPWAPENVWTLEAPAGLCRFLETPAAGGPFRLLEAPARFWRPLVVGGFWRRLEAPEIRSQEGPWTPRPSLGSTLKKTSQSTRV